LVRKASRPVIAAVCAAGRFMENQQRMRLTSGLFIAPTRIRVASAIAAALLAGASYLTPAPILADTVLKPYVDAQVQHDSNVFRVPNSETLFLANGDGTLADTSEAYRAGLDGTDEWGQQKLTVSLEGRHFNYNHYRDLDHYEYLGDVGLKWQLTHLIDGTVDLRQERLMAPFELGNSSRLTIDVDRKAAATVNLHVTPDWRVDVGGYYHKLNSPLQNFADFVQRETDSHAGVTYAGLANLDYGVAFDHLDGRFENAVGVGPYKQDTVQLTASYKVSGLTTLQAAAGYTRRSQTGFGNNLSAFTGTLGYTRQLTGKTSFNLAVSRAVNSYLAAGGSEVDTSASAQVDWQATYKIDVALNYYYVHSAFIGQFIAGSTTIGRTDNSPGGGLKVTYRPLRLLQLQAYASQQSRRSTVDFYRFNDVLYGIDAKLSFR
jgi:hypothetical protein